ncbi:MAG TPA: hypothetical protein VE753_03875 [Gaiellaceae bacterium]|nr:hypothetical protein [Gaiellaceae bacterium]
MTPTTITAASTGNDLTFTFTADSAALAGQTIVDVPPGWSPPQRTNARGAGYVELQRGSCASSTRLLAIAGRRITIAASCGRGHTYRLLYHAATAPRFASDGYVFLTRTRAAARNGKKVAFRPLGPHKQPVVRVRGGPATTLFMTITSVATSGTPFNTTVRAVDPYDNNAVGYLGTVTLTSTDPAATLPAAYTYGQTDTAQHTFTGLVLRTPGTQRITATDSTGLSVTSGPISVSPPSTGTR